MHCARISFWRDCCGVITGLCTPACVPTDHTRYAGVRSPGFRMSELHPTLQLCVLMERLRYALELTNPRGALTCQRKLSPLALQSFAVRANSRPHRRNYSQRTRSASNLTKHRISPKKLSGCGQLSRMDTSSNRCWSRSTDVQPRRR